MNRRGVDMDYEAMSVETLREELNRRGLPAQGENAVDLIAELKTADDLFSVSEDAPSFRAASIEAVDPEEVRA